MTYDTAHAITARITEIDNTISQLSKEKTELKILLEELATQDPVYQLAIYIHENTCQWNHTDGCSWYYEIKDNKHVWSGHAHSRALKQAKKLVAESASLGINADTVLKMNSVLNKALKV